MIPNPKKTVRTKKRYHRIEIGISTWSPRETSVRNRYDDPKTGRFSPHGSSEIPIRDLEIIVSAVAKHDHLKPAECARIITALADSITRQTS